MWNSPFGSNGPSRAPPARAIPQSPHFQVRCCNRRACLPPAQSALASSVEFSFEELNDLLSGAIQGVRVDVNLIHSPRQLFLSQVFCKPIRKVIRAQMKAQARRDEMELQGSARQLVHAVAEFLQRPRLQRQSHFLLDCLAKEERLEGCLSGLVGIRNTIIAHHPPEIRSQLRQRYVVADIQRSQLFRQHRLVAGAQRPLGKIIRKTFGQEMMPPEALEGMIKNRTVAARLKPLLHFHQIACRVIPDAYQIRRGFELKRLACSHRSSFSSRTRNRSTSPGLRTQKLARVVCALPTLTVIWFGRTLKASSSVSSSPKHTTTVSSGSPSSNSRTATPFPGTSRGTTSHTLSPYRTRRVSRVGARISRRIRSAANAIGGRAPR